MIYGLKELLTKMGAPEVYDRGQVEWHYFDSLKNDIAGYAEVRLEAADTRLVAELKHTRENYEDDLGMMHERFEESFYLKAVRVEGEGFKVTELSFDGAEYLNPKRDISELALSLFHARALGISILMVEQAFNKTDILDVADAPIQQRRMPVFAKPVHFGGGVVIPFRPRAVAQVGA